jgi:hypothetical protein
MPPNATNNFRFVGGAIAGCPNREIEIYRSFYRVSGRRNRLAAWENIEVREMPGEEIAQNIGLESHHKGVTHCHVRKNERPCLQVGGIGGLQAGSRVTRNDVGGIDGDVPAIGFFRECFQRFQLLHPFDELHLLLTERLDHALRKNFDPLCGDFGGRSVIANGKTALELRCKGRRGVGGDRLRSIGLRTDRRSSFAIKRALRGRAFAHQAGHETRQEDDQERDGMMPLHGVALARFKCFLAQHAGSPWCGRLR